MLLRYKLKIIVKNFTNNGRIEALVFYLSTIILILFLSFQFDMLKGLVLAVLSFF